jgi:urease accessory protein
MNAVAEVATGNTARAGWRGELTLGYERQGERTVLARRTHQGPLVVQKPLYPEGETICQSIVVHPPAGIVGGDRLALNVGLATRAWAQLTTPGASKWYRSAGALARNRLAFTVADGATLEWLPQETIVFDGALAALETRVALHGDARFLGWEIVCLGRRLAGEAFRRGHLRQEVTIVRDGRRLWTERALLAGDARLLHAAVGLNGESVFGTFVAAAAQVPDDLVLACRGVTCDNGECGVTRLPGLLLGRYRGASAESARCYFAALWACARLALTERSAVPPRIWNT